MLYMPMGKRRPRRPFRPQATSPSPLDQRRRETWKELIAEAGLRRDVIYDHPDHVEKFKAQDSTLATFQQLAEQNAALTAELAATRRRLAEEQATTTILRKALAELSL